MSDHLQGFRMCIQFQMLSNEPGQDALGSTINTYGSNGEEEEHQHLATTYCSEMRGERCADCYLMTFNVFEAFCIRIPLFNQPIRPLRNRPMKIKYQRVAVISATLAKYHSIFFCMTSSLFPPFLGPV
jgi:hypothetical protein